MIWCALIAICRYAQDRTGTRVLKLSMTDGTSWLLAAVDEVMNACDFGPSNAGALVDQC